MTRLWVTLILMLGTGSAWAQENRKIARVPFAFIVANQTLPAGRYNVLQVQGSSSPVFVLRNDRGDSIFVHLKARSTGNNQSPSITFACNAHDCVLATIAPPHSSMAFGLGPGFIQTSHVPLVSIELKAQ